MNESQRVEIKRNYIENQRGLCETAETHWLIYLIQAINLGVKLQTQELVTKDGKKILVLQKGVNPKVTGFTFGDNSWLVASSTDPELENMIFVEEGIDVLVGRSMVTVPESLKINGFYDTGNTSRWKDTVNKFIMQRKISPDKLNIMDLLAEVL